MHAPLKGRVFTAELGRKKRDSTKTEQLLSHLKEQKKRLKNIAMPLRLQDKSRK